MKTNVELEAEVVPGMSIVRRRMLWLPALTAAGLLLGQPWRAIAKDSTEIANDLPLVQQGDLGWDDFLKECVPTAKELHKDLSERGQNAYLYWIASKVSSLRLNEVPRTTLKRFKTLDFGISYKGAPFIFVEWKLEPGVIYPHHNHPNYSVCTVGIEGETRIRNFEPAGDAPDFSSKETFHIRETRDETITPGRFSTLTAGRDNIHMFEGGKQGGHGVDITSLHGKDVGFSFLEVSKKPVNTDDRTYEATWKKP